MALTHANGAGVRHAIARALATSNLAPRDAVFRVRKTRVDLDGEGAVARAEVALEVVSARPLQEWSREELRGLVNPDGQHPLMVWQPGQPNDSVAPFFMDILAVSWSRWLERNEVTLPPGMDSFAPVVGVTHAQATDFAAQEDKRLPTEAQFRSAWGDQPLPWGEVPDPNSGWVGRPRYDELYEGGMHPPTRSGVFDLGAWLWQYLDDGRVAGGGSAKDGMCRAPDGLWPVGIRLVSPA